MQFLALILLLMAVPAVHAENLTIERILGGGGLDGPTPQELEISPDGARVSFIRARANDQNRFDLWQYRMDDGITSRLVDADTLDTTLQRLLAQAATALEGLGSSGHAAGVADPGDVA